MPRCPSRILPTWPIPDRLLTFGGLVSTIERGASCVSNARPLRSTLGTEPQRGMIGMTRTTCWFLVAMLTSAVGLGSEPTTEDDDGNTIRPLFNFSQADAPAAWRSVNDGVMGGVSEGSFRISEEGVLRFFGTLSLENNGGFASIRSVPGQMNLGPDDVIVLRVRGDGREYLLNLFVPTNRIAYSYRAPMPTVAGKWIDVRVPIQAFVANSFGRPVPGAGPVDPKRVTSIGITLSDKKPGDFTLEVASIGVETSRPKKPTTRTFTYTETEHGPLEMVIHFPVGWDRPIGGRRLSFSSAVAGPTAALHSSSPKRSILPDGGSSPLGPTTASSLARK